MKKRTDGNGWRVLREEWLPIFGGCMLIAMAMELFLVPNRLVIGAFSGISTILYHTLGLHPGTTYFLMNLLLLALAFRALGKSFVFRTLAVCGFISAWSHLFSLLPAVTEDLLLATLFGGMLYGVGLCMIFLRGASSGGSDILGRLLQLVWPEMKIGVLLNLIDGSIVLLSFFVFGDRDLCLFGGLSMLLCNAAVDLGIRKMNTASLLLIVTDEGEKLAAELMAIRNRGCTILIGRGAYTNEPRSVLVCAARPQEAALYQSRINEIDPGAFVIFTEAGKIAGEGFRIYQ